MTDDQQSMQSVRGSVILCDYLNRMEGGKWLIAGTYNRITVVGPQWQGSLTMFVRMQTEQAGDHLVHVRVMASHLPMTAPPLTSTQLNVRVPNPNLPIDCGIHTPIIRMDCPVPYADLLPGQVAPLRLTIWVEVGGHTLSTAPLELAFVKPPDQPTV
ncbi:MAG: hypothetical protein AAB263_19235 [Planctomycetota bacterium]